MGRILVVVAFVAGLDLTTGPVGLLIGSGVLLGYLALVTGVAEAMTACTAAAVADRPRSPADGPLALEGARRPRC